MDKNTVTYPKIIINSYERWLNQYREAETACGHMAHVYPDVAESYLREYLVGKTMDASVRREGDLEHRCAVLILSQPSLSDQAGPSSGPRHKTTDAQQYEDLCEIFHPGFPVKPTGENWARARNLDFVLYGERPRSPARLIARSNDHYADRGTIVFEIEAVDRKALEAMAMVAGVTLRGLNETAQLDYYKRREANENRTSARI